MGATTDPRRAIEAGSIPHGDRAGLEEALTPGAGAGPSAVASAGPGSLPTPNDPIGALLSGEVSPEAGIPTAGLSVGPGDGPAGPLDIMQGDKAVRLRLIATQAATPTVRNAARRALRRMNAGNDPV